MKQYITSDFKLGIISGGQLGKLMILAANNWDIQTHVLDPSSGCPSANICTKFSQGDILDYDQVVEFGKEVDMIALEIENVNLKALEDLKAMGKKVFPDPSVLKIIQDKGLQKEFYADNNIPTSPFKLYANKQEIKSAIESQKITIPFVQKTRTAGYDGRGVQIIRTTSDIEDLLEGPSVIEDLTDIKKELSVIVTQNTNNEVVTFPTVEMVFNKDANLVEQLICPADISVEIKLEAERLAIEIVKNLDLKGILAVEMFLTQNDEVIINEVAPRPHNSGHHTIESTMTSQYEQYLRAILGFPLGDTSILIPSVMINLLGEPNNIGNVKYEGVTESMAIKGVKIHTYGKKETRPFRKMGHVTIMDNDINEAINKANKVKQLLKVKAW
ncbi:MAG: 5-(carboxyamino)imidazole ribonucleotide synthase [Vicingaceae bacterium]|nr:5-(carboxyamino)imidazole ribonucleotide synthase [Vicingaceae bacterium]